MKDMKAALGNASKPDITHVRTVFMTYIARACEYGSAKYERGNYMRPAGEGTTRDNFVRFGAYLRSAVSHIGKTLDGMELHLSIDPNLEDVPGMLKAMYSADTDVTPGAKVGASGLPHVAHGAAGLMMAVVQATLYGCLPEDPGQPWTEAVSEHVNDAVPEHVAPEKTTPTQVIPPKDYRDKCPHELLVGRHCIRCDGGIARRDIRFG